MYPLVFHHRKLKVQVSIHPQWGQKEGKRQIELMVLKQEDILICQNLYKVLLNKGISGLYPASFYHHGKDIYESVQFHFVFLFLHQ